MAEAVKPLERTVESLGFVEGARALTMVAWAAPSVLSSISLFGHPSTVGVLVAEPWISSRKKLLLGRN